MNPFDLNAMADLWLAGGKAMLDAQKQAGRAMSEGMQALGSGALPVGMDGGGAELSGATQSMTELWTAATSLFQTLSAKLPGDEHSSAADATLRSMMDPRSWTGGGDMEGVLARMAEGPRFADLWDMERRMARVTQAWVNARRASLEHGAVVLQAWMEASRAFSEEWAGHAGADAKTPDSKAAIALWTEVANRVLLATQRSEPFLRTQTATIRASTGLRLAQQELVEHAGRQYGFPTRTELDDVHRTVTELRREMRALKRARRQAAAAPPPAAPVAAPISAPISAPVAAPGAAPVATPGAVPVAAPGAAPVATPGAPPTPRARRAAKRSA